VHVLHLFEQATNVVLHAEFRGLREVVELLIGLPVLVFTRLMPLVLPGQVPLVIMVVALFPLDPAFLVQNLHNHVRRIVQLVNEPLVRVAVLRSG
jgi:hypothetical protein